MTDYIDRQALLEHCYDQPGKMISDISISMFPSSDVAKVVHGYWELEYESYGAMRCSVCKKECPLEKAPKPKYDREELLYIASDYCPYCGTKMDGDGNG